MAQAAGNFYSLVRSHYVVHYSPITLIWQSHQGVLLDQVSDMADLALQGTGEQVMGKKSVAISLY
jgi:hypothetical protein